MNTDKDQSICVYLHPIVLFSEELPVPSAAPQKDENLELISSYFLFFKSVFICVHLCPILYFHGRINP
jgi:hypothetical protein